MRGSIVRAFFTILVIFAPVSTDGQAVHAEESPVTCSSERVQCEFNEDNLIDAVMHVMTLEECRRICLDNESCQFISYFDDSATPVSDFCQLFKSCESITNCSNCVSENMGCFQSCSHNIVGDLNENVLDVVPNVDSEMACKQSCLNNTNCSFYTYFFPNSTLYHNFCFLQTAKVGDQMQASNVTFSSGEDTVTAQPGQDNHGWSGGDGYSGGGGGGQSYGGAGGTDGGDGDRGSSHSGGHGNGEDVSLYFFTTWSMGPGAGGRTHDDNGGGGGGLLVDGAGPQANSYQGAGYGGGGGYSRDGLQGVILMEIN